MSEWWTYHLSDFLLFSARTYRRLFEIYNAAIWPAQILAAAAGIAILILLRRGKAASSRWIGALLAAGWLWIGVAFLARRYAAINWSAMYFAWAFGIEAALLLWLCAIRGNLRFERPADLAGRIGLAIFVFACVVQPLIPYVPMAAGSGDEGARASGVQLFALCPDPTAVATLGLLLLARGGRRWPLLVIPILWCLYTGLFLLAMKSPDFWIGPLAAGLTVILGRHGAPSLRGSPRERNLGS